MTPIAGGPVLTAAGMRAAEERAISAGTSVEILMDRAGRGVATAVRRLASGYSVLVLCGPGNNGGDGYVAAAALAEAGLDVRVAATGEPTTPAAKHARAGWLGTVEDIMVAEPAPPPPGFAGPDVPQAVSPAVSEAVPASARMRRRERIGNGMSPPERHCWK